MGGWVGGWMGGWMEVKAGLRIAYSNQILCAMVCDYFQPKNRLLDFYVNGCSTFKLGRIIQLENII